MALSGDRLLFRDGRKDDAEVTIDATLQGAWASPECTLQGAVFCALSRSDAKHPNKRAIKLPSVYSAIVGFLRDSILYVYRHPIIYQLLTISLDIGRLVLSQFIVQLVHAPSESFQGLVPLSFTTIPARQRVLASGASKLHLITFRPPLRLSYPPPTSTIDTENDQQRPHSQKLTETTAKHHAPPTRRAYNIRHIWPQPRTTAMSSANAARPGAIMQQLFAAISALPADVAGKLQDDLASIMTIVERIESKIDRHHAEQNRHDAEQARHIAEQERHNAEPEAMLQNLTELVLAGRAVSSDSIYASSARTTPEPIPPSRVDDEASDYATSIDTPSDATTSLSVEAIVASEEEATLSRMLGKSSQTGSIPEETTAGLKGEPAVTTSEQTTTLAESIVSIHASCHT
jgi:hypothetical protein